MVDHVVARSQHALCICLQGGAPCLIGHNVGIISAGDQWPGKPGAPGLWWSGPRLWSLAPQALTWRGWGPARWYLSCYMSGQWQHGDGWCSDWWPKRLRVWSLFRIRAGYYTLVLTKSTRSEIHTIGMKPMFVCSMVQSDVLVSWVFWLLAWY